MFTFWFDNFGSLDIFYCLFIVFFSSLHIKTLICVKKFIAVHHYISRSYWAAAASEQHQTRRRDGQKRERDMRKIRERFALVFGDEKEREKRDEEERISYFHHTVFMK